jgi:hypothetical protein
MASAPSWILRHDARIASFAAMPFPAQLATYPKLYADESTPST